MPADPRLRDRLIAALQASQVQGGDTQWPVEAEVPDLGRVRVYARTCTPDHAGRDDGEHAAQMTGFGGAGPGGARGRLDLEGATTALLGYSPPFGVWVAWQPWNHRDFANSKSLQIHDDTLDEARSHGWAVAPVRQTRDPETRVPIPEVRVAFRPSLLTKFLVLQQTADHLALCGSARAAFMLAATPGYAAAETPEGGDTAAEGEAAERARVLRARLERSSTFAPLVRSAFADACAVCGMKLGVVEAAHLIPVTEPDCVDEKWNGLALCRNHHTLFDAGAFAVGPDLVVDVSNDYLADLRANHLDHGHREALAAYHARCITPPIFWDTDEGLRCRMATALARAAALRGGLAMTHDRAVPAGGRRAPRSDRC